MEYYPVIKKNEFLPFLPMRIDPKNITFSKISQRKTNITYMWNPSFKKDTSELTQVDLQILKTNLWLLKGKNGRRDRTETWDEHIHTLLYVR